ncbi:MAG: hypothetical protein WEB37_01635 [Bacteroidota bacterium]
MQLRAFLVAVALAGGITVARTQPPVILTESATTLGKGVMHLGLGLEYLTKTVSPTDDIPSSLFRVLGGSVRHGVADNVNFDLLWRGGLIAGFENGKKFYDWGDLSVWTTINFFAEKERSPAVALRTGIKLPNTRFTPSQLGNNQTDYHSQVLVSQWFGTTEMRTAVGFSIVGDPHSAASQDDLYSLQIAVTTGVGEDDRIFAELYGKTGYHDHDDKLVSRVGFVGSTSFMTWSVFGLVRLAGTNRDFASAFDCSETWSIGMFIHKELHLDL